jgi:hypothetical protein
MGQSLTETQTLVRLRVLANTFCLFFPRSEPRS